MIKIKIFKSDFHTFHPYEKAVNEFKEVGVEFTTGDTFDIAMIGHSIFANKKVSLKESTEKGLEYLEQFKDIPYILVDGQDSHSLIGTFDVFKHSKAKALLKSSLLKDKSLYKNSYVGGRYYWGNDPDNPSSNYVAEGYEDFKDRILLSGTNWIGVNPVQWPNYRQYDKLFDVSGMFQFPHAECHEHDLKPSQDYYYNKHRQPVMDILAKSPFMVAKLYKGKRLSPQEYYKYVQHSKVLLAPFGYGEMAPRDLEAAQLGSLLIKPTMGHIESSPFIYEENVTYIPCKHDYSDLEEKIEYAVTNYKELRDEMCQAMRKKYEEQYHPYYLPIHTAELLTKLKLAQ